MVKNKFKVVVSKFVYESILEIYRGICYDSLNGADTVRKAIIAGMRSLQNFPERYPVYDAISIADRQLRKMVVLKRYLIFYEVVGTEVRIYRVVDGKRDYQYLL